MKPPPSSATIHTTRITEPITALNAVIAVIAVLIACTYLDVGHSILALCSSSSAVHFKVEALGVGNVLRAWGGSVEPDEKIAEQVVIVKQTEEIAGLGRENEEQNTAIYVLQQNVGRHAEKVKEQNHAIAGMQELQTKVAEQGGSIAEQNSVIAGLERRADVLTHVFTWSTDSKWSPKQSLECTFTDGVRGYGFNTMWKDEHWMGFALTEGPSCMMYCKCSILDTDDTVLHVMGGESWSDFQEPLGETGPAGTRAGAAFNLTEDDKTGAVRADGSIKLRMVVHLYLLE
ncbi:hypothetical protein T484DRAFT_1800334 [Baffinella frigidus]|nr:hypothetical protein T484DRAFT_1800334 [Cryptophyta sp. CCMP2293]